MVYQKMKNDAFGWEGGLPLWWPNLHVPTKARGVWGHAPPGHFCYLYALISILVHSEFNGANKWVCFFPINMAGGLQPPAVVQEV